MRILITGGSGFIGSHFAEFHLKQGDEVHIVDDLSGGNLDNIKSFRNYPHFYFDQANILDWSELNKCVVWADRIYHLAALVGVYRVLADPLNVIKTNTLGTERLLNSIIATGSLAQVVISSSSSVYGKNIKPMLKETDDLIIRPGDFPLNVYAVSKIADEAFGRAYAQLTNLPLILVRYFNVVGPRQTGRYGMVIPRFVEQACKNEPITVFGSGEQTRSFCDVRDAVVFTHILANQPSLPDKIINVGSHQEITINELAHLVRKLAKSTSEIVHIPYEEAYGIHFSDLSQRRPDLTNLFRYTQYRHKWTLKDTIMDLISLFHSKKH